MPTSRTGPPPGPTWPGRSSRGLARRTGTRDLPPSVRRCGRAEPECDRRAAGNVAIASLRHGDFGWHWPAASGRFSIQGWMLGVPPRDGLRNCLAPRSALHGAYARRYQHRPSAELRDSLFEGVRSTRPAPVGPPGRCLRVRGRADPGEKSGDPPCQRVLGNRMAAPGKRGIMLHRPGAVRPGRKRWRHPRTVWTRNDSRRCGLSAPAWARVVLLPWTQRRTCRLSLQAGASGDPAISTPIPPTTALSAT